MQSEIWTDRFHHVWYISMLGKKEGLAHNLKKTTGKLVDREHTRHECSIGDSSVTRINLCATSWIPKFS